MGSYTPPLPYPWRSTPLIESPTLSRAAHCRVFLKLENLQPSGSFKSRGIGNLIRRAILDSPCGQSLHFYSSSGGNAGLAAVAAARSLGYPCTVVLPTSTEAAMIARLKAAGASDVVAHGDSWQFADAHLREVVMADAVAAGVKAVYVPPFDHERIWEGAETLVDEIREQMPRETDTDTDSDAPGRRPDAIVCSVGGGGLFSGVMQGLQRHGWSSSSLTDGNGTQVLAVETHGAESLHASLAAGQLVTLDGITSVAKSLGAVRVARRAFELASSASPQDVHSVLLTDAEACMGCWRFADDERILVEPACGASVALAYEPDRLRQLVRNFGPQSKVVIVVCGGSRIDLDTMAQYRETYGPEIEKMGLGPKSCGQGAAIASSEVPSSHTAP